VAHDEVVQSGTRGTSSGERLVPHQCFELVSGSHVTKRATIAWARQSGILSVPRVFNNEFLKEHLRVEEQQTKLAQQQSTIGELKTTVAKQQEAFGSEIAQQQKQIETLTATVQKVSDQIAFSKPAPQLVANP